MEDIPHPAATQAWVGLARTQEVYIFCANALRSVQPRAPDTQICLPGSRPTQGWETTTLKLKQGLPLITIRPYHRHALLGTATLAITARPREDMTV